MNKLYTIGHSTHTFDLFINILKNNQIDVVVDVRSIPYSQFADQYNKDNLKLFLKKMVFIIYRWETCLEQGMKINPY